MQGLRHNIPNLYFILTSYGSLNFIWYNPGSLQAPAGMEMINSNGLSHLKVYEFNRLENKVVKMILNKILKMRSIED